MSGLVVRAIKSEPKCKLCRHPKRSDIDALLLMRSNREKDADGVTVNLDYCLAKFTEWGVPNPNLDNVKLHWGKHCDVISKEADDAGQVAIGDLVDQLTPEAIAAMTVEEKLQWVANAGLASEMARIQVDGKSGITIDHVLRAFGELRQRRQEEATTQLMRELGGGIAAALGRAAEPKQLPEGEVVEVAEAEVVEVEA